MPENFIAQEINLGNSNPENTTLTSQGTIAVNFSTINYTNTAPTTTLTLNTNAITDISSNPINTSTDNSYVLSLTTVPGNLIIGNPLESIVVTNDNNLSDLTSYLESLSSSQDIDTFLNSLSNNLDIQAFDPSVYKIDSHNFENIVFTAPTLESLPVAGTIDTGGFTNITNTGGGITATAPIANITNTSGSTLNTITVVGSPTNTGILNIVGTIGGNTTGITNVGTISAISTGNTLNLTGGTDVALTSVGSTLNIPTAVTINTSSSTNIINTGSIVPLNPIGGGAISIIDAGTITNTGSESGATISNAPALNTTNTITIIGSPINTGIINIVGTIGGNTSGITNVGTILAPSNTGTINTSGAINTTNTAGGITLGNTISDAGSIIVDTSNTGAIIIGDTINNIGTIITDTSNNGGTTLSPIGGTTIISTTTDNTLAFTGGTDVTNTSDVVTIGAPEGSTITNGGTATVTDTTGGVTITNPTTGITTTGGATITDTTNTGSGIGTITGTITGGTIDTGNSSGTITTTNPTDGTITAGGTAISLPPSTGPATLRITVEENSFSTPLGVANGSGITPSVDTTGTKGVASIITDTSTGTLKLLYSTTNQFDYLSEGETATDTFKYKLTNANGNTDTIDVIVTITGKNDAPTANNVTASINEDSKYIIKAATLLAQAAASDAEGNALTIQSVQDAINGTVTIGTKGNITFTPKANYNGDASFTYTISDGHGGQTTETVNLTIAAVNDATVVGTKITDKAANAGTNFSYIVSANAFKDVDGDVLTYSAHLADGSDIPSWLSFNPATRAFTGVVPYGESSVLDLSVTASDGNSAATQIFHVNVIGNVISGSGNISGTSGNDEIHGSSSNDIILGGKGADHIDSGDGIDTASYTDSSTGVTVNLLTNANSGGTAEGDILSHIENITGSKYADNITGDAGDNVINGGRGADQIDGGAGIDTASYADSTNAVNASLVAGTTNKSGDAGGDVLTNIENIIGSNFKDTLTGNDGNNVLTGGLGADLLKGGLGNDVFHYDNLTDSNSLTFDTISDFKAGTDVIDLVALHTFGIDSFTDMTVIHDSAHNETIITANDDAINAHTGNTGVHTDFEIHLKGIIDLHQSDFIWG